MFREAFFLFSSERRMMRDFTILLLAVVGLAFIGAQATVKAMDWLVPAAQESFMGQARPAQPSEPRIYTVTRSVLDDPLTTGSIGRPSRSDNDCRR